MSDLPEKFQYDSCVSRGICSVSPRTTALVIVLVLYLKLTAKYLLRLSEKNIEDSEAKELVLNASASSSYEFSEKSFFCFVSKFKEILPRIIKNCSDLFEDDFFKHEKIGSSALFQETDNIIDAIKLGEKIIKSTVSAIPPAMRDLHQIVLVISRSLSINLLNLESFGVEFDGGFSALLTLLDSIDTDENSAGKIKESILKGAKTDNEVMAKLREAQEERYGKQGISEVSYTTTQGKAVLVVGSNIRELETILEALKGKNIDVYTHDDMMLAHTFPKFNEYNALKGQFGQGVENCLLDFATFPGPIILTGHSLHNIENLYRGRLFTTDINLPKGVVQIKNDDYSAVIESAYESKGFKNGRVCESVIIGYDFDTVLEKVKIKVAGGIKRIFALGSDVYSHEQKSYFEKLVKLADRNTLFISFSYKFELDNFIYVNTCFDKYGMIKILNEVRRFGIPVTVFFPECGRSTLSEMIYLSKCEEFKIYVGKCIPIILNPSLIQTLDWVFGIKSMTTARQDWEDITSS